MGHHNSNNDGLPGVLKEPPGTTCKEKQSTMMRAVRGLFTCHVCVSTSVGSLCHDAPASSSGHCPNKRHGPCAATSCPDHNTPIIIIIVMLSEVYNVGGRAGGRWWQCGLLRWGLRRWHPMPRRGLWGCHLRLPVGPQPVKQDSLD